MLTSTDASPIPRPVGPILKLPMGRYPALVPGFAFISYSHHDRAYVIRLTNLLHEAGIQPGPTKASTTAPAGYKPSKRRSMPARHSCP